MSDFVSLRNQFLIAMPALEDPNFFQSVTYICEHTEEGALGVTINHPMDINLSEVLKQLDIQSELTHVNALPVLSGGPVQPERGFIVHRRGEEWDATLATNDDIAITSSRDILQAMAQGRGPEEVLILLGYAGWGPGQLEREMRHNHWLHGPAKAEILFETPINKRWEAAAALLGIDFNFLSSEVGHA